MIRTRDTLKRVGAPKRLNMALTLAVDVVLAVGTVSLLTFGVLRLGWFSRSGETYVYQGMEWQTDPPDIPLTAEDLTGISYDHIRRWDLSDGSFLMSQRTYSETARQDVANGDARYSLSYTVTRTGIARLYDLVLEKTMANDDPDFWTITWQPSDPEPWGAEAVWRRYLDGTATDTWLLCWPEQIVGWSWTGSQTPPRRQPPDPFWRRKNDPAPYPLLPDETETTADRIKTHPSAPKGRPFRRPFGRGRNDRNEIDLIR